MADEQARGSVGIHVSRRDTLGLTGSIQAVFASLRGSGCAQIFTHGPHSTSLTRFDMAELQQLCAEYNIYVHSTYRTSWKPEGLEHMQQQFWYASQIGAQGVVLHLGKLSPDEHIAVLRQLRLNASKKHAAARIILEMRALRPDRWTYQTPEEINELCEALAAAGFGPDRVWICLDTAHLNAGQQALRRRTDAQAYIAALRYHDYIGLLHLNGNQYNSAERAGDHHCVPLSRGDWVWQLGAAPATLDESGALELARWFVARDRDVILEQEFSDELVTFYNGITALL